MPAVCGLSAELYMLASLVVYDFDVLIRGMYYFLYNSFVK
jgi:hypothetical protein